MKNVMSYSLFSNGGDDDFLWWLFMVAGGEH